MEQSKWIRSSFCESNTCIEVLTEGPDVLLRSTLLPQSSILLFQDEWQDFIEGVKAGEFDL